MTKLKYFGDNPLPRELVQEIHELEQDGKTRGQIVKELGVSYNSLRRHLGVRNNEESRARAMEKYDPYIDEIAVEKALRGERRAWDRLTYYERQEVRAALLRRSEREPYSQDHRSGVEAYWLGEWARSVGESIKTIRTWLHRAQQEADDAPVAA